MSAYDALLQARNRSMSEIAAQAVREVEAEKWGPGADTVRARQERGQQGWEDGAGSSGQHHGQQAAHRRRLSHVDIDNLKKAAASGEDHDEDASGGMPPPPPTGRPSFAPPPPAYARPFSERSLFANLHDVIAYIRPLHGNGC